MTIEQFFTLFLEELRQSPALQGYYKFLGNRASLFFRKSYFLRRLEYIAAQIGAPEQSIWDAGCGYGTTAIFLTLAGHRVHGSTLEFYSDHFAPRLRFWSQFADLGKLTYRHEDLLQLNGELTQYDRIIVQDALHHMEPIDTALQILLGHLAPQGRIIAIEENGRAALIRLPLFLKRGRKRVSTLHDEKLQRDIPIGNENVRSLDAWNAIVERNGLKVVDHEFIRCYPPFAWSEKTYARRVASEKRLWHRSRFLRDYGFMGLNFLLERTHTVAATHVG